MHIYFLGICGTAMGNAALVMKTLGYDVSGSDENMYPPMSEVLKEAGIDIREGYDRQRLEMLRPDLVVIGNALSRGNVEVEWLLASRSVPYMSLPEWLARELLGDRTNIVVTGTHGKTTTSALTAFLLRSDGAEPGFFIGGVPRDVPRGADPGRREDPFVIEGDEYDSAFFDKRSKFIHYRPSILVVNNIEFDHADIFRDLIDVKRAFSHLYRIVPANGWILSNGDDPNCPQPRNVPWAPVLRVGTEESNDLRIVDFDETEAGAAFRLMWRGKKWGGVSWSHGSLYNARNAAMAALAAGLARYPDDPTRLSLSPLSAFPGIRRRLEPLYLSERLNVFEDFAHHPTAVRETIASLRRRYPGRKLCVALEPRSNTMRRAVVAEPLGAALALADRVYLGPVNRSDALENGAALDTEGIAMRLRENGVAAEASAGNMEILEKLNGLPEEKTARVVVFFSNGSFDGIPRLYVRKLSKAV